nr:reverse transcriptase domain-containing protein [Tanacetum cinerariifolium]
KICPFFIQKSSRLKYGLPVQPRSEERPREAFPGINLYHPSIKILLTNKDKLCELARTPLIEHYSAVLLKKLLEKLGDPGKFLILCDFLGMAECLALADLGASNNLMPLSTWNKLSFLDFSPTCMTLELADRLISHPVGVAEDVYVKTERALIDVFKGELSLRVGKEAITFNLDQTSRHSTNYNDMTAKCIDVIDMACEEYSHEVLGFSDMITSGNPTPYYDPIVSTTSMTLTPFENSDFLFEEVDAFLALEDDPTSPKVDQSYLELKNCEAKFDKSSIDEPPEVELKDLPPHLEYAFLEGDDKLPVIIAKDLSMEEKTTLITEQMLERLAGNQYYYFLDGFFGYFQISIDPKDQVKTAFTCPYRTFSYRRMPFGLCNAPGTFLSLSHLEKMLKRCEDTNLCLNLEKSHFMNWNPRAIISDRGTHFWNDQFANVMQKFGVTHRLATPYHPQTSSQVEVSNRGLKHILERTLSQPDGPNFKVNGHRVKHYVGEDIPKMVVPDL